MEKREVDVIDKLLERLDTASVEGVNAMREARLVIRTLRDRLDRAETTIAERDAAAAKLAAEKEAKKAAKSQKKTPAA